MTDRKISERLLAIVPARGGSKGLVRKHLRPLGGRPLIAWTIESALASPWVDRVLVSTDDPEIADIARRWGAEAPFLRPASLSTDTADVRGALVHAWDWLRDRQGYEPGRIAHFGATYPFRSRALVEAVLEPVCRGEVDLAFTVREVRLGPETFVRVEGDRIRPHLTADRVAYEAVGSLSCISLVRPLERKRLVPVSDPRHRIDIDLPVHFVEAERAVDAEVA